MKLARLHKNAAQEPYWHVYLAIVVAICLQIFLRSDLSFLPKYLVVSLEALLLVSLILLAPGKHRVISHTRRILAILLIGIVSMANVSSLLLILRDLLTGKQVTGKQLLFSGLAIYLTNIIIYGLWYWELDNTDTATNPDFLFPQNALADKSTWTPTFFDYLYTSVTNASAFSPTDTMPLTHRAKLLMGLQSLTSFVIVALVAARAVNILS